MAWPFGTPVTTHATTTTTKHPYRLLTYCVAFLIVGIFVATSVIQKNTGHQLDAATSGHPLGSVVESILALIARGLAAVFGFISIVFRDFHDALEVFAKTLEPSRPAGH